MSAHIPTASELRADWYMHGRLRLRHLRLLVVLNAVNNLSAAASVLATTQPAVSRMLAEIEEMTGVSLFARQSNGTFATPHGQILVRHAAWILGDLDRVGADLDAVGQAVEKIQLGANSSSAGSFIHSAILAFRDHMPGGLVSLHEGSVESLVPALRSRKLDLVVARLGAATTADDLVEQHLFDESMVITCAMKHPLARRRKCSWSDLEAYPWILPLSGTPVRSGLDILFKKHGIRPQVVAESNTVLTNILLMDEREILSVVPHSLGVQYGKRGLFHLLPIPLPLVFGPLGIIMHRNLTKTPAIDLLIQCVRNAVSSSKK